MLVSVLLVIMWCWCFRFGVVIGMIRCWLICSWLGLCELWLMWLLVSVGFMLLVCISVLVDMLWWWVMLDRVLLFWMW